MSWFSSKKLTLFNSFIFTIFNFFKTNIKNESTQEWDLNHFSTVIIHYLLLFLFLFKWRTWVVICGFKIIICKYFSFFLKQIRGVREWEHWGLLPLTHFFYYFFIIYLLSWTCKSSKQFENSLPFFFFIIYSPFLIYKYFFFILFLLFNH